MEVEGEIGQQDPDPHLVPDQQPIPRLGLEPGLPTSNLDTNRCRANTSFIWCLPPDYNQEKHPFSYFSLVNLSLPWDYAFRFVIEEISNINDKAQTMSISMYFAVSWLEPRLQINSSAPEWTQDRTGPLNVSP